MNAKKILFGVFGLLLIMMIAAIVIPMLYRDRIKQAALSAVNNKLNAKVDIGDVDLSLLQNIHNFPNISIIADDVYVIGIDSFASDTLLILPKAKFSVDLMSIIGGQQTIKVETIELYDARIQAVVLPSGSANWEITKPSGSQQESKSDFKLELKRLILKNIAIGYQNMQTNQQLKIAKLNHSGKGDFTQSQLTYSSELDIEDMSLTNGHIPMLSRANIRYEGDIDIDQTAKKYKLANNIVSINALNVALDGWFQIPNANAIDMDLKFVSKPAEFKEVLSLIPAIYTRDYDQIESSGKFDLSGIVKGRYEGANYPKMNIALNINNGMFHYPGMPKKVSNINIASNINSPGGNLDNLIIDVPKFSMNIGNDPFMGRLNLSRPMSNPTIDLDAKGKLNLADIQQLYPTEGVKTMQGLINLDLSIAAKKSDVESKNYSAIKAMGTANINNLKYESNDVAKLIEVSNVILNFSPQYVEMPVCRGQIGKTDFDMNGKLENFLGYYLSENGVLKGLLNFKSNLLDANEFLPDEAAVARAEKSKSASAVKEYVMVPSNIDFTGNVNIAKMLYGKMQITNMNGGMKVANESVMLQNVKAQLLGGSATISGTYSTVGKSIPQTSLNYDINQFDIHQLAENMESASKIAPILKYMNGTISSKSNIKATLLPDLSPDLNTVSGDFNIGIPIAKVANLPILAKVAEISKVSKLNNLEVQNINTTITITNGQIVTPPINFTANNLKMKLQGSQGLDQSINYQYSVDVPISELGPASGVVNDLLSKVNLPFLNQVKPDGVRLKLNIKGFFDKPTVGLGTPEMLKGDVTQPTTPNNVAVQAVEEVKKVGENIKNEAVKKADSIKKQVQQEIDKKVEETKKQVEEEINKKKNEVLDNIRKKLPW